MKPRMATDDERREVARRLREAASYYESMERDVDFYPVESALGLKPTGETAYTPESVRSLADLIEPSGHECVPGECPLNVRHDNDRIDQERLLAIATVTAADSVRSAKQGISVSPVYILHAARDIAEACGETLGSIRNRELAKWGTSIVPKETIVDRDALLALADELQFEQPMGRADYETVGKLIDAMGEAARRIREACGEGAE